MACTHSRVLDACVAVQKKDEPWLESKKTATSRARTGDIAGKKVCIRAMIPQYRLRYRQGTGACVPFGSADAGDQTEG